MAPMCFTITVRTIFVGLLWVAGIVVSVLDALTETRLTALAVALMIGAATLSVLSRVDRYAASWETAYDAGREVAKVRQLR